MMMFDKNQTKKGIIYFKEVKTGKGEIFSPLNLK